MISSQQNDAISRFPFEADFALVLRLHRASVNYFHRHPTQFNSNAILSNSFIHIPHWVATRKIKARTQDRDGKRKLTSRCFDLNFSLSTQLLEAYSHDSRYVLIL